MWNPGLCECECNNPANIRLDEGVLKTSLVFVFSRRVQDVLIKRNIFASLIRLQKTCSRRLQDILIKTNITVLLILLQDVFKTSSRRLQNIFKTSSRRFEDVFKTSCKDLFKTFSKRIKKLNCSC